MEKDIISVSFVYAKSRLAPFRKTAIQRLELLACCIGALLSTVMIKALGLEIIPVFYWSDSSTALYWIEIKENWWQDNLKRSDWLIGRVRGIYPGKDNHVRVVKVKTKAGELTRPVKKLYPLELSSLT
ncbi:hypothetical protein NPIL_233371 [Nephila pilipes]|uniref:DUF5641 domain-containing protein n=1 Tax=Nephila pilipes TaxID=299642 RepID=A0A8X6QDE0_NEPPI|nr:hypothetical protein NPIL_233371 [Nephila pilipes]